MLALAAPEWEVGGSERIILGRYGFVPARISGFLTRISYQRVLTGLNLT